MREFCARSFSGFLLLGRHHRAVVWSAERRRGCFLRKEKKDKDLSWHMCWAFLFLMWGCRGEGNGNVLGWGCGWWVEAAEHCTYAHMFHCSYVAVALICVMTHFSSKF